MAKLWRQAQIRRSCTSNRSSSLTIASNKVAEEADNQNEDSQQIDELARNEHHKEGVIARANARVKPWAVVIVACYAPLTHVAMITAWQ